MATTCTSAAPSVCLTAVATTSTSSAATASTSDFTDSVVRSGSEEESQEMDDRVPVLSILDRLSCPTAAEISRMKKKKRNSKAESCGKHRCRGSLLSDPKGISSHQRVKEFEKKPFTVEHGQIGHLFCFA